MEIGFFFSKNCVNIGLISWPNVNFVITVNIFPYNISQHSDLCDHFVLQYQSRNLMALTYKETQIEKWIKVFILRQEVLAEDELEENSDSEERAQSPLGRKISHDRMSGGGTSRKMSAIESMLPSRKTSASSSNCPSRKWSRHSSPTRGEVLRMEDEMHTVNRGGVEMTIPLNITHHIPPRLIGHLDEEGILLCDKMLTDGYTVAEIIEYFK